MRSINDILKEGLLDNTEKSLAKGETVMKKDILNELKNELRSNNWYSYANDALYEKIINACKQLPDNEKKGTRWQLIMPDKESNFKPIFVAIHKGLYRNTKGADKELYSTTASAMHKRIAKEIKMYKDEALSTGWILSKPIAFVAFLMNEYTRVNNISGNDWYTISVYSHYSHINKLLISYNPTTKEWAYGPNNNIPAFVNSANINKFGVISDIMLRDELHKALYISYLSDFTSTLPHGNPKDFKRASKFWRRLRFAGGSDNSYKDKYLYVHTKNFVYLTPEDIANNTTNSGSTPVSDAIQKEIEYVKTTRLPNPSISDELDDYIKNNFTLVDRDNHDKTQKWYKLHAARNDSKYGAYMVCLDTKQRRPTTHAEF